MEEENGSIIEEQNQKSTSIWTKRGKRKRREKQSILEAQALGKKVEKREKSITVIIVCALFVLGVMLIVTSQILRESYNINVLYTDIIRELGVVIMVIAVIHSLYEFVIHQVLHKDIAKLGHNVEKLQRTVSIIGGAIESGLAAVYGSRDEVNKAILEEMEDMESGSTLRLLGISLGAFLCPHGALHGAFRKLLERKDITIEVLILDTNSDSAINRAQFEEPRFFFNAKDVHEAYQHTRCHNELKTATDFAQDLADRCYYRDQKPSGQVPFDAPIEPKINAKFEYLVYDSSPLCYLVIFDESMFLESYHNAGRGGESPVLKISKQSGETTEITSLFKIYEYHYEVMKGKSSKRKENVL